MHLKFSKYHGTGNDFIMVYNHNDSFCFNQPDVKKMCSRRNSIGADGLIIIEKTTDADFKMIYYNADGFVGSMCGNGARCAVSFAKELGLIQNQCEFLAYDGLHKGLILENGLVSIEMVDVSLIEAQNNTWKIDTGSPHLICFRDNVTEIDVKHEGASIRNSIDYIEDGINVNFVQLTNNELFIRTYERGVEDETLSCGTGAIASAIAAYESDLLNSDRIKVKVLGGQLEVSFSKVGSKYSNIHLIGPTKFVFNGEVDV